MQFTVISLVVCVVVLIQAKEIPKENVDKGMMAATDCIAETEVETETLMKIKTGVFEDDPKLKSFLACFNKKTGAMNEKGEWQLDFVKAQTSNFAEGDPKELNNVIEKCFVKKGTVEESAFEASKCLYNNLPEAQKKQLREN